jgi:hypothetical protein
LHTSVPDHQESLQGGSLWVGYHGGLQVGDVVGVLLTALAVGHVLVESQGDKRHPLPVCLHELVNLLLLGQPLAGCHIPKVGEVVVWIFSLGCSLGVGLASWQ